VHLTGIVVRDLSCVVSNYRSKYTLDEYLQAQKVPGIANVDTRAITRRLRETGAMNGVIAFDNSKRYTIPPPPPCPYPGLIAPAGLGP